MGGGDIGFKRACENGGVVESYDGQVAWECADDRANGDISVEGGEAAPAFHCQREQVEIGDFLRSEDPLRVRRPRVEETDVVGPELVARMAHGLCKALDDRRDGERIGIGRL